MLAGTPAYSGEGAELLLPASTAVRYGGGFMSIYRKPDHEETPDHDVRFTGAPRSKAESMLEAEREAAEQRKRSKAEPTNIALPRTLAWAATLPPDVQPTALIRLYGRIANVLALDWNDPLAVAADFDQLLMERRGKRKGFPPIIVTELRALARHYGSGQPSTHASQTTGSHNRWEDVRKR